MYCYFAFTESPLLSSAIILYVSNTDGGTKIAIVTETKKILPNPIKTSPRCSVNGNLASLARAEALDLRDFAGSLAVKP